LKRRVSPVATAAFTSGVPDISTTTDIMAAVVPASTVRARLGPISVGVITSPR
jgi:hypothetical protein